MEYMDISFSSADKNDLLKLYTTLQPFSDVVPALKALKQSNYTLVAFSNGVQSTLKTLLSNANLLDYLEDIVSVDALQTFKPNPIIYKTLATQTGVELTDCWVVSSNPFDVIGGTSAGLNAAWIQRDANNIFDPWEYKPDITVKDLIEFAAHLQ
jgi:2-haloacid dehalogenase